MKLKLKLDKDTILAFFLQHVEKLVLGLVCLCVLLMLYAAFNGMERFPNTPDKLKEYVANGKNTLDATKPDSAAKDVEVKDYANQARQNREDIREEPYQYATLWDQPLFEQRPLRDKPALYAVEKLQGAAGNGVFRLDTSAAPAEATPARTDGRPERPAAPSMASAASAVSGQRWIVITGLVPLEKQTTAYDESLKQSVFHDPQTDVPTYLGYWVERVEMPPSGDLAKIDWTKATTFTSQAMEEALQKWAQVSSGGDREVVAPRFLDKALAFPLGPLVNETWGVEAAHAPEIPMLKREGTSRGDRMSPTGGQQPRRPAPGTRGGIPGASATDERRIDMFGTGAAKDKKPAARAEVARPEAVVPGDETGEPSFLLFRFFDFNVEPGKHYVYRVCLGLDNPNLDKKDTVLKNPELATEGFLKTKWSEPTPAISVPRDTRVYAVSVAPLAREPSCTVFVTKWLKTRGIDAFVEKDKLVRGQVCDFRGVTFTPPTRRSAMDGTSSTADVSVNFETGAMIVDFRGGKPLPARHGVNPPPTTPGDILLLDSDGNLVVRNELDDHEVYERHTKVEEEPDITGVRPPPGAGTTKPAAGARGLDAMPDERGRRGKTAK